MGCELGPLAWQSSAPSSPSLAFIALARGDTGAWGGWDVLRLRPMSRLRLLRTLPQRRRGFPMPSAISTTSVTAVRG